MQKKDTERVKSRIRKAEKSYQDALEEIARQVSEKYVRPFCESRGYGFLSGNGTFAFFDEEGDFLDTELLFMDVPEDQEDPAEDWEFRDVVELCELSINTGRCDQGLGSYMPDIETEYVKGYGSRGNKVNP